MVGWAGGRNDRIVILVGAVLGAGCDVLLTSAPDDADLLDAPFAELAPHELA